MLILLMGFVVFVLVFNNGLTIQYGYSYAADLAVNCVFSIAFTNTNYVIFGCGILLDDETSYIRGMLSQHKYITHCLLRTSTRTGPNAYWLAIGATS